MTYSMTKGAPQAVSSPSFSGSFGQRLSYSGTKILKSFLAWTKFPEILITLE